MTSPSSPFDPAAARAEVLARIAAAAVLGALDAGRGVLLDVPLAGVARWLARGDPVPSGHHQLRTAPPRARPVGPRAADLGTDTIHMLA